MKEEKENIGFSDKLDVYKFMTDVGLKINKDVKSDFVLAKLGEKEKEGAIELTADAYFARSLLRNYARKCFAMKKINKEQKEYMIKLSEEVFNNYMTKLYMMIILNRNVPNNHMLKMLAGEKEEEEEEDKEGSKVVELIKPKGGKDGGKEV